LSATANRSPSTSLVTESGRTMAQLSGHDMCQQVKASSTTSAPAAMKAAAMKAGTGSTTCLACLRRLPAA
jgi:hypothetical protein